MTLALSKLSSISGHILLGVASDTDAFRMEALYCFAGIPDSVSHRFVQKHLRKICRPPSALAAAPVLSRRVVRWFYRATVPVWESGRSDVGPVSYMMYSHMPYGTRSATQAAPAKCYIYTQTSRHRHGISHHTRRKLTKVHSPPLT